MEVVSAVTKRLNIAGKLNIVKLLLLTIYIFTLSSVSQNKCGYRYAASGT